jgi:hypothetical protein
MGRPAVLGGDDMGKMSWLLVLRIPVWRRRVLHVVISVGRA